ncbi:MAG: rod shape-determining protein MreD [Sulfuricellaceae bacterium]|nr:rod shape-determining protein MreD [Sulfuricellaceae bacterium]
MSLTAPSLARPPSGQLIFASLFVGLMLNLLPWEGASLLLRPDLVLLMLLYWTIRQPLRVGMGAAWGLGLAMDVADGALLGQYALAYTVSTYLALILHRRIQSFSLWPQALHVLVLLLVAQTLTLLVHLLANQAFIGFRYFLASLTGALFWPVISIIIELLQKQKSSPDVAYPAARGGDK